MGVGKKKKFKHCVFAELKLGTLFYTFCNAMGERESSQNKINLKHARSVRVERGKQKCSLASRRGYVVFSIYTAHPH